MSKKITQSAEQGIPLSAEQGIPKTRKTKSAAQGIPLIVKAEGQAKEATLLLATGSTEVAEVAPAASAQVAPSALPTWMKKDVPATTDESISSPTPKSPKIPKVPMDAPTQVPATSAAQGIPQGAEEVHSDLSIPSPTPLEEKDTQVPTHAPTLTTEERAYGDGIVGGTHENLREYLKTCGVEYSVIEVLLEKLPSKKGPIKGVKSTHPNPCQAVWEMASQMKGQARSAVVAACVAVGVSEATARTQYQKWYEAGKK